LFESSATVKVPSDSENIVYSNKLGFYYSNTHKLTVCPNPECQLIHGVSYDDYVVELGIDNFNIWIIKSSAFQAVSNNGSVPVAVCQYCIESHDLHVDYTRCEVCLVPMPNVEQDHYNVHYHKDTNYKGHHICNKCANDKWNPFMTCFCGKLVHEVDTINIKPPFIAVVHNSADTYFYNHIISPYMQDFQDPSNFEALYLFVDRGCTDCVSEAGKIKESGMQAVLNSVSTTDHAGLNLNLSNVCFIDYHNNPDVSLKIIEVFYLDQNTGEPIPSIVGYIKKNNPGYCARITKESQIF